jgi:sugar phosphate isomerase/epimerase
MKTIKGPAIFLAQFAGDERPFDNFDCICGWAASLGFKGVQIPSWDARMIDLKRAATSRTYCDEIRGVAAKHGIEITELASHLLGHQVAVHPAYDEALDAFAAPEVRGNPAKRQAWAVEQVKMTTRACHNLGLAAHVTFSGALAWPYLYPYPPRPEGLIDAAFTELAGRWKPILDLHEDLGVDCCYEIHPGEDVMDGYSFEFFLDKLDGHKRCCINYDPSHFVLQGLDYLEFIDIYHERIKAFHVKDAELNPTGRQGVYSGFAPWPQRAGRFRSLGDGQVDFAGIFSKLTLYGYGSWAVLEWECALKDPLAGAREGAEFIAAHIIPVSGTSLDAYMKQEADQAACRRALGLDR